MCGVKILCCYCNIMCVLFDCHSLPTLWDGNNARLSTEIYQKESSSTQKVVFSKYDVAELDALLVPGTLMDAYFSLDPYDFQQNAGIRLVAKKLVMHSS